MLENLKGGGRLHFLISYTYGIADFLADFMVCADFMGGFILTPKSVEVYVFCNLYTLFFIRNLSPRIARQNFLKIPEF